VRRQPAHANGTTDEGNELEAWASVPAQCTATGSRWPLPWLASLADRGAASQVLAGRAQLHPVGEVPAGVSDRPRFSSGDVDGVDPRDGFALGSGYLPPGPTASDTFPTTVFTGKASFGFNFSCEDKGGLNPPTGQLRLHLTYADHGTSQLLSSPFSIHGSADELDPVLESMLCIGAEPAEARPERADLPGHLPANDTAPAGLPLDVPEA
jgi:hypothetical protein